MLPSNDWAASEELIDYILKTVPVGETILELGSGQSTEAFVRNGRKVIAIEHDPEWIDKTPEAIYIYAPIRLYGDDYQPLPSIRKKIASHTGWYDHVALALALRNQSYSIILVDGPPRNFGRSGFLQHLDIFPNLECPIVFDDLDRIDDLYVAARVAAKLERDLLITNHGETRIYQKPNGDWCSISKRPFGII